VNISSFSYSFSLFPKVFQGLLLNYVGIELIAGSLVVAWWNKIVNMDEIRVTHFFGISWF